MSLKRTFGWKFARFDNVVRRLRAREIARTWQTNRPAAIGITAVGVLAAAVLIAMPQSASRKDTKAAARAAATVATADPAVEPSAPKSAAVTITGCLERDDETFRLKDTEGADAPRSRSWKTGFLKKGSASIQVIDAANRLKLTDHVGQRVSVTGTLVEREMRARSLQRIAPSCATTKVAKSDVLE